MSYSRHQGIQDAQAAISDYSAQKDALQERLSRLRDDSQALSAGIQSSYREIAAGLLSAVSADAVQAAAQVLGATTPGELRETLEAERRALQERRREIEADSEFASRESLIGQEGSWNLQYAQLDRELSEVSAALQSFRDHDLIWLEEHPQPTGFWAGLWDWLNGNSQTRKEKTDSVLSTFRALSLNEIRQRRNDVGRQAAALQADLQALAQRIERLEELTREHAGITCRLSTFDDRMLGELRGALAQVMDGCDSAELRRRLPENFHLLIGKAAALKDKLTLLEQLSTSLSRQIDDRQQRIVGVQRVLSKWRRSSRSFLRADKTAWLRTLPQSKASATGRWLGHWDVLYGDIIGFDDYLMYSLLLGRDDPFIPYMAFCSQAEERAPLAFAQALMPGLAEECQEHPEAAEALAGAQAEADEQVEEGALSSIADEWQSEQDASGQDGGDAGFAGQDQS